MNLVCEANRNSALFSTMQNVLEVVNPLVTKERPTVVNESKEKIQVQPSNWGNTWSKWNGAQTLTFDIPRMGPMTNFNVSVAFKLPGKVEDTSDLSRDFSAAMFMGMADPELKTGGLDNTNTTANTARGRLDRVYSDELIGFNMIESYRVLSKTKEIFSAPGEYLLLRYNQLPTDVKEAIFKAITPVRHDRGPEEGYYGPGLTYIVRIPLWFFFNEHISHAIDVNFTEAVRIEIRLRSPSELFWYGNLGCGQFLSRDIVEDDSTIWHLQFLASATSRGFITWDQSTTTGSKATIQGSDYFYMTTPVFVGDTQLDYEVATTAGRLKGVTRFGTVNVGMLPTNKTATADDKFTSSIYQDDYNYMINKAWGHTIGICGPLASPQVMEGNPSVADSLSTFTDNSENYYGSYVAGSLRYYAPPSTDANYIHPPWQPPKGNVGYTTSGPTFAFPAVDNRGQSPEVVAMGYAYFLIQDTDAARALRAQQFPEGSGFTSLPYNVSHEVFKDVFKVSIGQSKTESLISRKSGGNFKDGQYSNAGVSSLEPTSFVDCPLRDNHLVTTTSFMVRKHSDLGGDGNPTASKDAPLIGRDILSTNKKVGAYQIYTRCLPVQHFQIRAAGRVIYESDGDSHLLLDQSVMYPGTRKQAEEHGEKFSFNTIVDSGRPLSVFGYVDELSDKPFFIYTINWGLLASRLQHTGALSLQNLNQPTLRIYFRADSWAEYCTDLNSEGISEAMVAASRGVRVDVLHEHYNVLTINSGNGEITTGLNQ